MIWPFRKRHNSGLVEAQKALAETHERGERVEALVKEIRVMREVNHFGESLYWSMARRPKEGHQ